ncbi:MAG: LptF/LptG family permease [Lentisphaerae bacterium]|nr:LptF/LptG family permease [Lentisphaerota bacterium]
MKLIDKYLLREYMTSVFFCLSGFVIIHFVYDLFFHLPEIIKARVPINLAAHYYLCLLAPTMEYVVPSALLLATLYTLWQLTRHNELTAMRAGGVSLFRLMMPFIMVGIAFSLITAVITEGFAPQAKQLVKELDHNNFVLSKHRILTNHPYANSAGRRHWQIGKLDIKNPTVLHDVLITQEREDGTRAMKVFAQKAEWLDRQWWFYDVSIKEYTLNDHPKESSDVMLPGSKLGKEMPFLSETPMDFVATAKPWEFLSSIEMAQYLKSHPDLSDKAMSNKKTDLHLRMAMPWACFIVALFGIPAGAKTGRESILTGMILAFVFFFGFYALTQVGVFLGKTGIIQPWLGAWLSNIVFLMAGIGMMARLR